jgi:ABC-type multidrug transport system ATPase subunit
MNDALPAITGITLSGIGKKFGKRHIFRNIDLEITSGEKIAINGSNGSGKSTLLKIISGYLTPYEGSIRWTGKTGEIAREDVAHHLTYAAPYLDLIDRFTLRENVDFFCRMKNLQSGLSPELIIEYSGLQYASEIPVQDLSSGMRQRLKLSLAFMADSGLLLLDEPLSNLDNKGYQWYANMAEKWLGNRMVVVCSNNVVQETAFCSRFFNIESGV